MALQRAAGNQLALRVLRSRGQVAGRSAPGPSRPRQISGGDHLVARQPISTRSADPTVQRAVGYEVEVGGIAVNPLPGVLPPPNIRKGLVLWSGAGWDASVDELPGGTFDLEFRTDPVDDLAAGGRSRAASLLGAIREQWLSIENQWGYQRAANLINASAPTNVGLTCAFPPNNSQLQASAGLSLDALSTIRSGRAINAARGAAGAAPQVANSQFLNLAGEAPPPVTIQLLARQNAIRGALNLPPAENIDDMLAVIGLIVEIPFNSYNANADYPKAFAGGLLARTNFAVILEQLPPTQLLALQHNDVAWRTELETIIGNLIAISQNPLPGPLGPATPIFRPASTVTAPAFDGRLAIRDWLTDLPTGADRLTATDYEARHPLRPVAEAQALESLGSYGERMDAGRYALNRRSALELVGGLATIALGAVNDLTSSFGGGLAVAGGAAAAHGAGHIGTAIRNRPIFEFRALLQPAAQEIVDAGLALWDYVDLAHGRDPAGANQISTLGRLWNWVAS